MDGTDDPDDQPEEGQDPAFLEAREVAVWTVVEALDEYPTTAEDLAYRLETTDQVVEDRLEQATEAKLVVHWGGGVWATTWRSKLVAHPGFFKAWLPASLAIGLAIAALAGWLHGPEEQATLSAMLGGMAVVAAAWAGLSVRRAKQDAAGPPSR